MANEEFNQEWNKQARTAEKMQRWDADLMGPPPDEFRNVPAKSEQDKFIDNLGGFLDTAAKQGYRQSDFRDDVDKRARKRGEKAVEYDLVQFYKEIEESIKSNETKWTRRAWNWLFGRFRKENKYQKKMEEYFRLQQQLDEINAEIHIMRQDLAALEVKLTEAEKNPAEDRRIRERISRQQEAIRNNLAKKTGLLSVQSRDQLITNSLWAEAEKELEEEQRKITNKFGHKIQGLFADRQNLILKLSKLTHEETKQLQIKYSIQEEINRIDMELESIKKEIIAYKSERPIFLFERAFGFEGVMGIKSIPILAKRGQITWDKKHEFVTDA
ncbi:hypothetical protein JW911_03380 [Candidatus Peregrinibacteria bacterium]|nr:hypothetical protein [Candidatus Peregrinibacteria bacterium]